MNNKRILLTGWLTACLLLLTVMAQAIQVSFGKPEKINEQWEFYPGDNPAENTKWRTLDLPHDWSIEGVLNPSLAACTGYLPGGIARYRKQIFVPEDKKDEKVYVYFEGVSNRSEVYLNGHLLGKQLIRVVCYTNARKA
jgi:beta-galactosidase/beta-glucuronidase